MARADSAECHAACKARGAGVVPPCGSAAQPHRWHEDDMIRELVSIMLMGTLATLCATAAHAYGAGASGDLQAPLIATEDSIPQAIVDRASGLLVSRLGQQFFEENIRFNPARSQAHPSLPRFPVDFAEIHPDLAFRPCFRMVFDLTVREKPWAESAIEFFVDSRGDLLPDLPVLGVPGCVDDPRECQFPIDKERAANLAEAAGFGIGLRPWTASFGWQQADSARHIPATYVWRFSNTLVLSPAHDEGATIAIDANSGEVVFRGGWAEERLLNCQ